MGILADIYRGDYDCEVNACYGKERVCIVNAEGPFKPNADTPPVLILAGHVPGAVRAAPAVEENGEWYEAKPDGYAGPMMGGTYIATSDSRFNDLIAQITGQRSYGAVPLHDRYETWAEYEALSR